MTPRSKIISILKENGIKVKTKRTLRHEGRGYFVRGGRDRNKYVVRIYVDDIIRAKELIDKRHLKDYENYCLTRYGDTSVELMDMKYYKLLNKLQ